MFCISWSGPSRALSSVVPVSGSFAQCTLCHTFHQEFGRQLLVECSLIAVPECLVEADADVMGVRIQCMDSAKWPTYGRSIETVSISFDGCGFGMGGRSPMFVDQGFGVLVKSPGLWRQAPCLRIFVLLVFSRFHYCIFPPPTSLCYVEVEIHWYWQIPIVHFQLG